MTGGLKKVVLKSLGFGHHGHVPDSDTIESDYRRVSTGSFAVYVGPQRYRFVISTRYHKLPVFLTLFKMAEEQYGFQSSGGVVLPCDPKFFKGVLELLHRDEKIYGRMRIEEFVKMFGDEEKFDRCRESQTNSGFTPLLKAVF